MAPQNTKPPLTPATRYEDDLYTWVQEQVALLRSGRLGEIDAANVAEELSDVGKSEFHKLKSALAVLIQHLLKWDLQPKRRSRSWAVTVRTQRDEINDVLTENPGLKSRLDEALAKGYRNGRNAAIGETDIDEAAFPEECPCTIEEIMARPIVHEPPVKRRKR